MLCCTMSTVIPNSNLPEENAEKLSALKVFQNRLTGHTGCLKCWPILTGCYFYAVCPGAKAVSGSWKRPFIFHSLRYPGNWECCARKVWLQHAERGNTFFTIWPVRNPLPSPQPCRNSFANLAINNARHRVSCPKLTTTTETRF